MKSISSRPQFCAATKVAGRIGNNSTNKEEIPDQSSQQIKNPEFRYKENSFSHFSSNSAISCEGRLIFQKHLLCAYPGRKHALKETFYMNELKEGISIISLGAVLKFPLSFKSPRKIFFYSKKESKDRHRTA